ncbi:MAG: hypothetical protein AAFX02_01750 [Pseudomonadota bacterium]
MRRSLIGLALFGLTLGASAQTNSAERLPFGKAFSTLGTETCLAYFRGDQPIEAYLPEGAEYMLDPSSSGAWPGSIWEVDTLEGKIYVGTIADRGRACQVLGQTLFSDVVIEDTATTLSASFAESPVDANSVAANTWRRFISPENEFVDITETRFEGFDKSTVRLVVG